MTDDVYKFPAGSTSDEGSAFEMSGEDQAALDALIEAGFEVERVGAGLRERAARVGALLGLIGSGPARTDTDNSETLIDLTLARVQRMAARESELPLTMLSPRDEDALEALIGADYDPAEVAGPLRRRASRQADLLAMLEPARAEMAGGDARIARTLSAVQGAIDARERSFKIEPAGARGRRFRVSDVLAVAALLLIASAAIGPMVGAMRQQARQASCQAGLLGAGQGLASYATDWRDALPLATASVAGNPWWYVGVPEKSNSANLYKTISAGYAPVEQLACAGNPGACRQDRGPSAADWRDLGEVSYSFQNQFAKERAKWTDARRFLVLVDASPVVRRAIQRRVINPFANSANHGGAGQNALFSDGSVEWLKSPVLASGDNIWLPGSAERRIGMQRTPTEAEPIEGTESPDAVDDAFVGP